MEKVEITLITAKTILDELQRHGNGGEYLEMAKQGLAAGILRVERGRVIGSDIEDRISNIEEELSVLASVVLKYLT